MKVIKVISFQIKRCENGKENSKVGNLIQLIECPKLETLEIVINELLAI